MASELDDFLGRRCSLTKRQIECLSLQISRESQVKNDSREQRPHEQFGVSEGAYYRVLSQAKNNVDQAVYTILLCSRMGIIQGEDLKRLVNLMGKAPSELPEAQREVISLVDALVRKIVML
jgi:hypothetical protein